MNRKRTDSPRDVHTPLPGGVAASLSGVLETAGGMTADLRAVLRIAYLRLFVYTVLTATVLLVGTVFVYDFALESFDLYDAVPAEVDLIVFAVVASVPMINAARLLFLARISGKNAMDTFTPTSLLRGYGLELAIVIAVVPFLSRELFEATGIQNVIQSLAPLWELLLGTGGTARVQETAVVLTVLYLYPAIVLVYLSHSKLSRLYPFTQFLTVARSWNYALLVGTTIPVVLVNLQILNVIDRDYFVSDLAFAAAFVLLTTVTFQFVFVRLGSIVVTDRRMWETFTREVDREVQTTLSQFG